MIFATVGSQAPFDRLIRAIDEWAGSRKRLDVFAQIASSKYKPRHIAFTNFMDQSEFDEKIEKARLIVAHAGMGSIISALQRGKPILVMPRRAHFRETRNDHQVAAAKCFGEQSRIIVAYDETELPARLDEAFLVTETTRITMQASPLLISTIRTFVEADR